MLFWIITILVLAVLGILAYAAMQPDAFRIVRSQSIAAPPDKIFPLINDMRALNSWNPFVLMDPAIKGTYSGPPAGPGAAYAWESQKMGPGRTTITGSTPPSRMTLTLEMDKPIKVTNQVEYTLTPNGKSTDVTWAMSGKRPFMIKVMGLFMNMDQMVGKSFSKGLADLKVLAET